MYIFQKKMSKKRIIAMYPDLRQKSEFDPFGYEKVEDFPGKFGN